MKKQMKVKKDNPKGVMDGKMLQKNMLFILVFASSFIYIIWRLLFTLPLERGTASMVFAVILWICESGTVTETFTHFQNARKVVIPDMPVLSAEQYLDVDVMICTHNETEELLYKTLNGCKYMDYPERGRVHIWLCDDKNRPEMKALTERMGVGYFGFDGNQHAKAGNINYALPQTDSPFIAIFDADMIPTSNFLMETVPYFYLPEMIQDGDGWRMRTDEEKQGQQEIGYVQTHQSFYNPDVLMRNLYLENNAPNEQDYFYRSVNVARMNTGSAAFAGSNAVFSRKVLKDAGWLATHSITEDFATSIAILGRGYRALALDKELAHGLSPEDAFNFIKQRQRWSRGAAQGIMTRKFWCSGLPLKAKWNFMLSYFYWWTYVRRLVFILCPILYGLFGIAVADVSFLQLLMVWLPYYLIYNTGLKYMSGGTTSAQWSSILDAVQFPYMISPIVLGTLKIPQSKFWVSPKDRVTGRNSSLRLGIPHMILALLTGVTVVICTYDVAVRHYDGSFIVLFWALFNLYTLLNAIVYYYGRKNNRYSERVNASVPVKLSDGEASVFYGNTFDLSEGGMAVLLDVPEYLPFSRPLTVTVTYKEYEAVMLMRVLHVQELGEKWKYSLKIEQLDERNKSEYYQILYDRDHTFPRKIDLDIASDVQLVLKGITTKPMLGERRLPRISLEEVYTTEKSGNVSVMNFNYKYILLKDGKGLPKELTLQLAEGLTVHCFYDEELNRGDDRERVLYQIQDWETLAQDPALREYLVRRYSKNEDRIRVETRNFRSAG